TGQGVPHAVDGELRPALTPEVGGHLRRRDVAQNAGQLPDTRRVATVELADVEAQLPGVGPDCVATLVHAGADRNDAAERALASHQRGHALVVDAVLEVDDDAVGLQ